MSAPTEREVRAAVASVTAPTGQELWAANRQLALWRKSGHVFDQASIPALETRSCIYVRSWSTATNCLVHPSTFFRFPVWVLEPQALVTARSVGMPRVGQYG